MDITTNDEVRLQVIEAKTELKESILQAIALFYKKTGLMLKNIEISNSNYDSVILKIEG